MQKLKELFVDSINNIGDSGYKPELEDYIAHNFNDNYGISTHIEEQDKFPESLLLREINQHLVDLGFMQEELFNETLVDNSHLLQKINNPLSAYFECDKSLRDSLPANYNLVDFLPIINQRLRLLTSVSGEYIIQDGIILNQESSLDTRVLHYRLKALGLFFEDIGTSINKQSMIAARKVRLLTGVDTLDSLKNKWYEPLHYKNDRLILEGNLFNLLSMISSKGDNFLIATNSNFNGTHKASSEFVYTNNHFLIYGTTEKEFKDATERFRLSGNWRPDDSGSIHQTFKLKKVITDGKLYDESNRFKLELLQVLLWTTGYYLGRTDGIWGATSTEALFNFIEQEELDKYQIYLPLTDGTCIINLDKLIPVLLEYNPANAEHIVQHLYETITDSETQDIIIKEKKGFFKKLFENAKKIGRRVYYGLKTIVNSASRALSKIWQFLKNKVFGPVISFFKHLYNQIKEGVSYFLTGLQKFLHFILRKPFISAPDINTGHALIITKYDFDSDSVNFSNNEVSLDLVSHHQKTIKDAISNYQYFLDVIVKTINFIVTVATFNWVKLALYIGKIVTQFIQSLIKGDKIKLSLAI